MGNKRSQFLAIGGLEGLRAIFRDFYVRVFDDIMIGFMFSGSDAARLVEREAELTARILGASEVTYRGLGMRRAHAARRIMGGQFARRMVILKETLVDHDVPEAIIETILSHNEAMRPLITGDQGTGCDPAAAIARAKAAEETFV